MLVSGWSVNDVVIKSLFVAISIGIYKQHIGLLPITNKS
ncbi:hypothetical protein AVDCRST_MAG84-6124 [uncultured Microcoleus sp.]|uniref:Uncharacterized protein n=1 Tax=uncultured Microcoleus sp. TaxID=259945 RepID=A0A6J4P4C2_9CYAN|nr:hypothetical protein AVDCRST_MAG84-6124 [uncultured Microcoleus sp.]